MSGRARLPLARGCWLALGSQPACTRNPRRAAPPPPRIRAKRRRSILTGQWVAIVNEDWRWRMVTPPKGDYASVPLNDEGRRVADQWDPAQDGACEAYGAAALLRMPTRLRIRWDGDDAARLETDAGRQTRAASTSARRRRQRRAIAARAIDGANG